MSYDTIYDRYDLRRCATATVATVSIVSALASKQSNDVYNTTLEVVTLPSPLLDVFS